MKKYNFVEMIRLMFEAYKNSAKPFYAVMFENEKYIGRYGNEVFKIEDALLKTSRDEKEWAKELGPNPKNFTFVIYKGALSANAVSLRDNKIKSKRLSALASKLHKEYSPNGYIIRFSDNEHYLGKTAKDAKHKNEALVLETTDNEAWQTFVEDDREFVIIKYTKMDYRKRGQL